MMVGGKDRWWEAIFDPDHHGSLGVSNIFHYGATTLSTTSERRQLAFAV